MARRESLLWGNNRGPAVGPDPVSSAEHVRLICSRTDLRDRKSVPKEMSFAVFSHAQKFVAAVLRHGLVEKHRMDELIVTHLGRFQNTAFQKSFLFRRDSREMNDMGQR
uniref:Uncharacterized protein n=1 Tax=Kalanchoe fedtschenkoi TaxID=63787 RepID=A0A7N0UHQ6_KALFE